jgi:Serine dehydrogenase proteinase
LQQRYKKFSVYIPSYCKSAGTLLAIGAQELIMGEFGELGPLDIQIARRDELGEMSSGLVVNEALVSLQKRAIATFMAVLKSLKEESSGQITLKTAMQTAREMTVGLLAPIYGQVEPTHLGELTRAMKITEHYGQRLSAASKNLKRDALQNLVAAYPSHYVAIDRQEAATLFNNVREPSEQESELADLMHEILTVPPEEVNKSYVAPLSQPREADNETAHDRDDSEGAGGEDVEAPRRAGTGRGRRRNSERTVDEAGTNGREHGAS